MQGPPHAKLTSLFSVLTYCLYSRREKLMFTPFFLDLWQLFHPFMLEPQIPLNHNKQALMTFWFNVSQDCPENLQQMVTNQHVCKNIAFNYILADHDDEQNIHFNRGLLPAYYGLLRLACQFSPAFMRQLSQHQNLQWAFKNVLPYPHHYLQATEELMLMMKMMAERRAEAGPEERAAVEGFRKAVLTGCTPGLEPRIMWQTLLLIYKVLIETPEDRMALLYQNGLSHLSQSMFLVYTMYHEATACHVTGDLLAVLHLLLQLLAQAHHAQQHGNKKAEIRGLVHQWKERNELAKKLLTLLNSFVPSNLRAVALDVLQKMVLVVQKEITHLLGAVLLNVHSEFQHTNPPMNVGPFYPTRAYSGGGLKASVRPARPQFQMYLHAGQLEISKGSDEDYDDALLAYYEPYHRLIDRLARMAINLKMFGLDMINLHAIVAYEGVPLHLPFFAKLWNEIIESSQTLDPDHSQVNNLLKCNSFMDYMDTILIDERRSLNNDIIFHFFRNFFPKVHEQMMSDGGQSLMMNLVASVQAEADTLRCCHTARDTAPVLHRLLGELRALQLVLRVRPRQPRQPAPPLLPQALQTVLARTTQLQQTLSKPANPANPATPPRPDRPASRKPGDKSESDGEEAERQPSPGRRRRRRDPSTDPEDPCHGVAHKKSRSSDEDTDSSGRLIDVVSASSPSSPAPKPSPKPGSANNDLPPSAPDHQPKDAAETNKVAESSEVVSVDLDKKEAEKDEQSKQGTAESCKPEGASSAANRGSPEAAGSGKPSPPEAQKERSSVSMDCQPSTSTPPTSGPSSSSCQDAADPQPSTSKSGSDPKECQSEDKPSTSNEDGPSTSGFQSGPSTSGNASTSAQSGGVSASSSASRPTGPKVTLPRQPAQDIYHKVIKAAEAALALLPPDPQD